ncbi:hypothetical protein [Spirosoma koreense]
MVGLSEKAGSNQVGVGPDPLNGTPIDPGTPGKQSLYVTLVSSGSALSTIPVTVAGTYSFTGVSSGTYSVAFNTNASGSILAMLMQKK